MAKNVDIKIEFPNLINKLKSLKVKDDRYESSLFFDENYLSFKILDKENPERHTLNGWLNKGTYKEFIFMYYPDMEGWMDYRELRKIWKPGDPTEKFPNPYPKLNAIQISIPEKFFQHSYREDNASLFVSLGLKKHLDDIYNREDQNKKHFKFSINKKKEAEDFFLHEVNNWKRNLEISKFNENEFKKKAEEFLKKYKRK